MQIANQEKMKTEMVGPSSPAARFEAARAATKMSSSKCVMLYCWGFTRTQQDNVRVIPDAGDIESVGADTIAKLSA